MYQIRRFGVVKTSTIVALMYVIVVAIFFVPAAFLLAAFGRGDTSGSVVGVLGVGLLAAALYGILGWVFTAIACALYNLVAGWVGGIEVQVERVDPPAPPPVWGPSGTASPPTAPPTG